MAFRNLWHRICSAHRAQGDSAWVDFFFPRPTLGFFLRSGSVALLAILIFGFVLTPCIVDGGSMLPNWPRHGFTFCFRQRYWFSSPERGDVVIVRYKDKVSYLKRVVGLPGDIIAFRRGELFVNGKRAEEPYVRYVSDWELPPRRVHPGHFYVVGDNRSQPISGHIFGQVRADRIIGAPLY